MLAANSHLQLRTSGAAALDSILGGGCDLALLTFLQFALPGALAHLRTLTVVTLAHNLDLVGIIEPRGGNGAAIARSRGRCQWR